MYLIVFNGCTICYITTYGRLGWVIKYFLFYDKIISILFNIGNSR